jgi:hypothetical protein
MGAAGDGSRFEREGEFLQRYDMVFHGVYCGK